MTSLEQLFCPACEDTLPFLSRGCIQCANPINGGTNLLCGQCQRKAPAFDRTIAVFQYQKPIDHVVQQYKFHERLYLARWLGRYMSDKARQEYDQLPQLLIPVPLHAKRTRQRGFNQALELARVISRQLSVPVSAKLCQRQLNTPPQSELSASDRLKNLRGAFQIRKPLNGEHIALIDDVMTTGTTINELAQALKKAGAGQVDAWVIARTSR